MTGELIVEISRKVHKTIKTNNKKYSQNVKIHKKCIRHIFRKQLIFILFIEEDDTPNRTVSHDRKLVTFKN